MTAFATETRTLSFAVRVAASFLKRGSGWPTMMDRCQDSNMEDDGSRREGVERSLKTELC